MNKKLSALVNANIVTENGIIWDGVILISDDEILDYGRNVQLPESVEYIDAQGAYVGPGFVDIHVHGGGGFLTYENPVEASEFFLKHGETTILATPSYNINFEMFLQGICTVKNQISLCRNLRGLYLEGPYTNPQYGSHADKNPWRHGVLYEEYKPLVDEAGKLAKVWTIAPEIEGVYDFIKYAKSVNPDVVIAVGHSEATPEQIRALGKYKPTLMTHAMNATGRLPVGGGLRAYGPDEYCFKECDMYAELISDSCGIHVHPDMQQLLIHTKGINKTVLITDSTDYDNVNPPQYAHVKDLNFDHNGGIAGSKMTMEQACKNIMTSTNCGIAQAFLMASSNPAKVIGMFDEIGSIENGKKADLVFVDDKFNVKKVMLRGEVIGE